MLSRLIGIPGSLKNINNSFFTDSPLKISKMELQDTCLPLKIKHSFRELTKRSSPVQSSISQCHITARHTHTHTHTHIYRITRSSPSPAPPWRYTPSGSRSRRAAGRTAARLRAARPDDRVRRWPWAACGTRCPVHLVPSGTLGTVPSSALANHSERQGNSWADC